MDKKTSQKSRSGQPMERPIEKPAGHPGNQWPLLKRAMFLDRDGTIIEHVHYIKDPNLVQLLPNSSQAIKLIREKGYSVYVVSNQSGVGRGLMTHAEFEKVHIRCMELFEKVGIVIDDFLYCFHTPEDQCGCRKPAIHRIKEIAARDKIDLLASYSAGDSLCDLELARNFGGKPYLVRTGLGSETYLKLREENNQNLVNAESLEGPNQWFAVKNDLLEVARALV